MIGDTFLVINRLVTCSFANEFIFILSTGKIHNRRNILRSEENGSVLDNSFAIYTKTKYRDKLAHFNEKMIFFYY